jgi:CHAT domain-containing protein
LFYRNKALPQYKAASNKNGEFETRLEINKMNFYKDQEQVFINAYKQVLTTFSKDISATELAIAEADLAKLYFHNNEFDLALKTIDSAFERASNYYINSFFSLSEEDKLNLKSKLSILLDAYSTYLVYSGESNIIDDQLFRYLKKHQWLNSVTLDNLGMIRRLAKKSSDNNINRVYKEWEAQKENLSQAYLSNINSDILILEQVKANRLEEKLYNLLLNDDSIESLVPKVDWDTSLKINLNDNESAIQIIKYNNTITKVAETNYVAIIINNDQTLKLVPVKNSNQLESDYYSYYRSQIENQKLDTKSFDRFWGEIDNSIDRDNRIYFSGDGIYQLVNPLTLYNSKTSSYLLKELDLIQTENLMTAIEQGVDLEIKSINHVNLFGSPNYTLNSGSSFSSVDNYFAQLPGTEKEVESISELFKQKGISVSTFLFDDASEKNVKEISSPSILHIASHGYFNESELINEPQEVEIGAISFNREGSLSRKTDYRFQNRMVQTGLIFTGANNFLNNQQKHLNEDGILTALEVSDLNLIDTDLVVLSACETGSGELVSGEGVFGLKRALSIAGVKSMIISLWEVDDQATNELMVSFYNNLLASNDLDRSLKESQLYLQSKYPHPYFWGSFILTNSK